MAWVVPGFWERASFVVMYSFGVGMESWDVSCTELSGKLEILCWIDVDSADVTALSMGRIENDG